MKTRIDSLLERADWVLNRGTNWKTKQAVKFSMNVMYTPRVRATLLDVIGETYAEFEIAKMQWEFHNL